MTLATDQKLDERGLSAASKSLLAIRDAVLDQWERDVRAEVPGARDVIGPVLINTLPAFYDNMAEAITPSYPRDNATSHTTAAAAHGGERARMTNFGPDQIIHEYQLFRAAVMQVSQAHGIALNATEQASIERSIDCAVRESIREFTAMHEGMRQRLAASLSHDMRSPLAVIANAAQFISLSPDLEAARRMAIKIEANAKRLEQMMEELLDALTVERGEKLPLTLTQFDIHALALEMKQEFDDLRSGTIEVVGESILGYWCRNSMRRALENLVVNAFKYGDRKLIRVKINQTRGRLVLTVHNTGAHIPKEQRERIFGYLQREGTNSAKGWGIGLPFVRSVAESHGGSVAVDSSPETGTTFLIDVPIDCRQLTPPKDRP
jgi:signal transduction histidine kinase